MLGEDEKQFLTLWDKMSPYLTDLVLVMVDKKNFMLYFAFENYEGNIGRFEFNNRSGFNKLKDHELYKLKDLIQ